MKTFRLMTIIAASLMVTASCNNQSNTASKKVATTEAPQSNSNMTGDTSKFTLNMVDNKKDFVCRMPLTAGIADTVHYKGKVYGFCSAGCKESFLQNPESYLAEGNKK